MNINTKQVYRHTHLTKTFWDHEFLMDFVLENGFYLWSKSVENFGQPGCFSDPLPSSRTRTTPQNDSQGLPTGGITPNKDLLFWEDPFLFGSFVRLLTYILDWTLNLFFPASPHVKAFACGCMFDVWTAPQEQDSIPRLPLQFVFFWPKRHSNLDLLSSAGWF